MTNAELLTKIKAEIERRLKDYWKICFHDVKAYNEDSNVRELKELLSFLSTLESEKPMNQDGVEEELDRFIASGKSVTIEDCGTYKVSYHDFKKVARHFAKWGAEHLKK